MYRHVQTGESIIRTTSYSLPEILHDYIDLIQPTTMFARFKAFKSTLHWTNHTPADSCPSGSTITGPAGNQVNASCNNTITVSCLRQLYNAVDYNTSATNGNVLGITGYLNESTNNVDLQQFYRLQNPSAYGSNYTSVSIHGMSRLSYLSAMLYCCASQVAKITRAMKRQASRPTLTLSSALGSLGPRPERSTRPAASLFSTLIC